MPDDFNKLICPVCGQRLSLKNRALICEQAHSFDLAKENYVNLLLNRKSGDKIGDNAEMAKQRAAFLSKEYFLPLALKLIQIAGALPQCESILDICCGEGYYSGKLKQSFSRASVYGFDISKEMIRLAAKKKNGVCYFVANMTAIPMPENSVDFAFQLFSPFCAGEFARVLKPNGLLCSAAAGKNHLLGLKRVLYENPYPNEELPPEAPGLILVDTVHVQSEITLSDQRDIMALFGMTPYYYHTPTKGINRLSSLTSLTTPLDFVIYLYKKERMI